MFSKSCVVLSVCVASIFPACQSEKPAPSTLRLSSIYKPPAKASVVSNQAVPKTEFRFEKSGDTSGWTGLEGVEKLTVKDGFLSGHTTSDLPILHLQRKSPANDADTIHSIEVKIKVSAGTNFRIGFDTAEKPDIKNLTGYIKSFPEILETTPIIAGQFQTYTIKPRFAYPASDIRNILVVPTDQKNADFEIESIRLLFRKEYLATIPSGVSWQSMKGIYHETIVSRSPEVIHFDTKLPQDAWLDLSTGTIEDGPVKFRVSVQGETLFEHTITRPHQWQPARVRLGHGGQNVALDLSIETEKKGMVGFWGSPVIRSHILAGADPKTKPPQGVILVWTDTLRKDHLDVYGYRRSTAPNLKQIASEGVLFQNCVSQATWTKVASPTMFTGLYPLAHGVLEFGDRLPTSAETMAEVFQNAGFATIGFSSNLFTGTYSNFHQGFDELHEDSSLPNRQSSKTSREYMDRLIPWMDQHKDVPFFVFFHAYDAHDPYEPYEPYNTMWADGSKKAEHEKQLEEARKVIHSPLMKLMGMPDRKEMMEAKVNPEQFVSYAEDWYDGSIRGMDAEIARLMEYLRTNKMDSKTLLVIMADHGEEFLDHDKMFHGQSVYGELTAVPLILHRKGAFPAGAKVKDTVESVDLMPSILELAGLHAPKNVQGKSFVSLLRNVNANGHAEASATWNRPAFSMKAATHDNGSPPPLNTESFSVVLGNWKLIHNTIREEGPPVPEYELFDFQGDPLNKKNVAEQNPEIVKRLSKLIEDWRVNAAKGKLKPDAEAAKGLSQEELERLRSLGYIQ